LSYYTVLGLYIISVPGLWSQIKRSTKPKIVRKQYSFPGPALEDSKGLDVLAREVTTFFIKNNYKIADAGEVITFEGNIQPSRGQAFFLAFCTFLGLGSLALVLSITIPAVGDNWYWTTLLSPLAGVYYWENASKKEVVKAKMVTSDDDKEIDLSVEGPEDAVEDMRRTLDYREKGKVYVKGILES